MIEDGPSVLHKHPKVRDFVQVENSVARAPDLSFKASGLLIHILSLPDGSPIGSRVLAEVRPDGRHAIMSAYQELRERGYIEQRRERRPDGTWCTITEVWEVPADRRPGAETEPGTMARFPVSPGAETAPSPSEKDQLINTADRSFVGGECYEPLPHDEIRKRLDRARRDLIGDPDSVIRSAHSEQEEPDGPTDTDG